MTNFNGKLNLLKLKRAGVMQIQGRTEVLRCLVIPIEDNNIFISSDENNRPKGLTLTLPLGSYRILSMRKLTWLSNRYLKRFVRK